jgi:two-component system, cell cycle response regulator
MLASVLVIDDAPAIHRLVKARLGKEPLVVHSAYDAAGGLAAAREIAPDLILLDVELPDRDGFAVCAELKAGAATMNIPIIFLTRASSTDEKIRGLELGATDYITKPFDPAELRARVRASLRTKFLMDLLARKAMIDGLTGLWNRAYLESRIESEVSLAQRTSRDLSCIMVDVDQFKAINDSYGHKFGDDVLRAIADAIALTCRAEDIVCRYGGEEFTILLPSTTSAQAAELAERLRATVEATTTPYRDTRVVVTCSFGVAPWNSRLPQSVVELADQALYLAKCSGRNRVEVSRQEGLPTRIGAL